MAGAYDPPRLATRARAVGADWQRVVSPNNQVEIQALLDDAGQYLGYIRVLGRRQAQVKLEETIVSLPANYTSKLVLRTDRDLSVGLQ